MTDTTGQQQIMNNEGEDTQQNEQAAAEGTENVTEEVDELQRQGNELPPPSTRPMRDAVPA